MIASLFHITHLDNVACILHKGLLCRNRIETLHLPYLDLSDASCQARRSSRDLGGHTVDLHNYVPLFIEPRNAMLYRLEKTLAESGDGDDLVILEVNGTPAQWHASLLSDGIASSPATHLFHATDPGGWEALDWDAIRCRTWKNQLAKRHKMAEVLVHGTLNGRHIRKIWVKSPAALQALRAKVGGKNLPTATVADDGSLFFS
ncbi:DUF4433 domain-containing protein [Synechococcus sp. EJ6-Ellesmere]|uniref:DUF4433 domain-containing protein n=1 Tax=Synechococcus sp. EJ6-Ellesmere TaxID=2823734 RepID=UPI0020CE7B9C|nr:DUF4433 domain-containing protein [Synechococcus sp. EJ6-Ellesmere]MCP9826230.1 DUF4433 domain-containing protein [Synechococcus sp. EJ6-Ellesmere]